LLLSPEKKVPEGKGVFLVRRKTEAKRNKATRGKKGKCSREREEIFSIFRLTSRTQKKFPDRERKISLEGGITKKILPAEEKNRIGKKGKEGLIQPGGGFIQRGFRQLWFGLGPPKKRKVWTQQERRSLIKKGERLEKGCRGGNTLRGKVSEGGRPVCFSGGGVFWQKWVMGGTGGKEGGVKGGAVTVGGERREIGRP